MILPFLLEYDATGQLSGYYVFMGVGVNVADDLLASRSVHGAGRPKPSVSPTTSRILGPLTARAPLILLR